MLKQLRLSGILDSIEQRNRQGDRREVLHMDFLAMILQDEVARRSQKRFSLALRRASFRSQKTLEDFDFTCMPGHEPRDAHRSGVLPLHRRKGLRPDRRSLWHREESYCPGAGACGTCAGYDALFSTADRMLSLSCMRPGQPTVTRGNWQNWPTSISSLSMISGLKPLKGIQDEDFHDVISERYANAEARLLHPIWTFNGSSFSKTASSGPRFQLIGSGMALIKLFSTEKVIGPHHPVHNNKNTTI